MASSTRERDGSEASGSMESGWVSRGSRPRDEDEDPTDGFTQVARAFQSELRDEMLATFERLVARRRAAR
jgi:hypothetical protein